MTLSLSAFGFFPGLAGSDDTFRSLNTHFTFPFIGGRKARRVGGWGDAGRGAGVVNQVDVAGEIKVECE
jgi:hypothetical protein